ncbi:DUF2960 domain-containing protein [Plesiomonas sp.]|uniref:DUF2960 domain-containing protein n=1 Tax=Plesiomonas sp. TaxID=2486279 RepID=UPI003F3343D5
MARRIVYTFKGKSKEIPFAYTQYHDMYEAVAKAEGIDLKAFIMMEQQVAATSKGSKAVKDFRHNYFLTLGFTAITFVKDDKEEQGIAGKA